MRLPKILVLIILAIARGIVPFRAPDQMKLAVSKSLRQRGVLGAAGFEGSFDTPANRKHMPDYGSHVAIPTRKESLVASYTKPGARPERNPRPALCGAHS